MEVKNHGHLLIAFLFWNKKLKLINLYCYYFDSIGQLALCKCLEFHNNFYLNFWIIFLIFF